MLTVGIDIGTSYSSISIINEMGLAEPIKVSNGACAFGDSFSMPSAVFVEENGNVVIGQIAMTSRMKDPSMFKAEFKRDLGQSVPYVFGSIQMMPEDCYKEIIIHFIRCAEKATGKNVSKAYITYPANYSKRKKELILAAAKKAGLLDVEAIDEPTAAAYYYYSKNCIKPGEKLLVYDFGGGTFDVSFIHYTENGFKSLTDAIGIERCGGSDIDRMIFDDIYNSISEDTIEKFKSNTINLKRFQARILEMSVRAKHQLSTTENFEDIIEVGFDSIPYSLSHEKLNSMIAPIVEETMDMVRLIVKNSGLKMSDIDKTLIVGGTTRIPYVQERLRELTGKQTNTDVDPDLAVCQGAALKGKISSTEQKKVKESKPKEVEEKNNNFNKQPVAVSNNCETSRELGGIMPIDALRAMMREVEKKAVAKSSINLKKDCFSLINGQLDYIINNVKTWIQSENLEHKLQLRLADCGVPDVMDELYTKASSKITYELNNWISNTLFLYLKSNTEGQKTYWNEKISQLKADKSLLLYLGKAKESAYEHCRWYVNANEYMWNVGRPKTMMYVKNYFADSIKKVLTENKSNIVNSLVNKLRL